MQKSVKILLKQNDPEMQVQPSAAGKKTFWMFFVNFDICSIAFVIAF